MSEIVVDMANLSRVYRLGMQEVRAVDSLNLSIRAGEFVTVAGRSGSGKSTLLNLIGCLDQPDEGSLKIDGLDTRGMDDRRLSELRNRKVGFVFQHFHLLPHLNVIENIALPLVYRGVRPERRSELARLAASRLGLEDRLDHKPSELSGGQCQRVAIARALVGGPGILLADEPTGSLDSATAREIQNVFFDLNRQGMTVIMVTHDPVLAEGGTRVVQMEDGKVTEDRPSKRKNENADGAPFPTEKSGEGRVGLWHLAKIGFCEGLLAHKLRSLLTMLGVIIGTASVIAMSSFSLGSKKKQADLIRSLGVNLVRIADQSLEGEKLIDARRRGSPGLSLNDMAVLQEGIPDITLAAASREARMNVLFGTRSIASALVGVHGNWFEVNRMKTSRGRELNEEDMKRAARVAVVGPGVAKEMGGKVLGEKLLAGGTPYTIVGVMEERRTSSDEIEATGLGNPDTEILVPLKSVLLRTVRSDLRSEVDELRLQIRDEEKLAESGMKIRRILSLLHGGVEDFSIVIPLELLRQKHESQRLLDLLTLCISAVSLIVGGIGIMNIMLASVNERLSEIGLRRALGASKSDILHQFLAESTMISSTGGLVGVIFAVVSVAVVCAITGIPFVLSPWMTVVSVSAAILTGLVFGLHPAMQAADRNPVETLRRE